MSDRCAGCGADLNRAQATGESAIYSPHESFLLCEPCWLEEDALIDASGTNDHPNIVAAYVSRTHAD